MTVVNFSQIVIVFMICARYVQISMGIEAEINFNVEGNGFHRTLIYNVYFKNLTNDDCRAAIYLELPSALYVNVNEIAEFRRRGMSTVCSVGETDIELFVDKAKQQNVTVCASVSSSSTCVLTIPIHQRYQHAREIGGYVDVLVPEVRLLLGCQARIRGHRVSKMNLCDPCIGLVTKWREISYNILSNNHDYVWSIPVGDSSLSSLIMYVTLSVTIVGTIFIAHTIRTNALKNRQKKD